MFITDHSIEAPGPPLAQSPSAGPRGVDATPPENGVVRRSHIAEWYAILLFTTCYVFSNLDRQILNLFVDPIRTDLHITETEFSFLQGFAFSVLYASLALPIGYLVDSKSRKLVMVVGTAVWTAATTLTGFAVNFGSFCLGQIGIGAGEAALSPAAYSILADTIPKSRLPVALSIYSLGISLGTGGAYLFGGLIVRNAVEIAAAMSRAAAMPHLRVWQIAFIVGALPSAILTVLLCAMRDVPRRPMIETETRSGGGSLGDAFRYLREHASVFAPLFAGTGILASLNVGLTSWVSTFATRVMGWDLVRASSWIAWSMVVLGSIGILIAGVATQRLLSRGVSDAAIRVLVVCVLLQAPFYLVGPLLPGAAAMAAMCCGNLLIFAPWGVAAAAVQAITPSPLRGRISAIYLFVSAFLSGLGPTIVAFFTQYVFRDDMKLGWSFIATTLLLTPIALIFLFRMAPHYRRKVGAGEGLRLA